MKAKEVAAIIEEFAPLSLQEGWDNAGFSVGESNQEVTSVLVALDCTPELILEAVELGANMIITHHPLIFGGVKKITFDNVVGRSIQLAIQNNIVLYSAHTNADKVWVSKLMAERLNLENVSPLDESLIGVVGDLPCEMDSKEFVERVKSVFSLKSIRYSQPLEQKIRRVALCGGSGKSMINASIANGAQAYITGDIPYHEFFCRDNYMILDIGHYESEIDFVENIISILKKKISNFAIYNTTKNNNPIYYI